MQQHLEYVPFGEVYVDQRSSGFSTIYRYTGKEQDAETKLHYYGARYYDSKVSRFLSVDPLADQFPNESPYIYAGNNPIANIDVGGLYKFPAAANYSKLANYLQNGIGNLLQDKNIRSGLRLMGGFTDDQINSNLAAYGSGITITVSSFDQLQSDDPNVEVNGWTRSKDEIYIHENLAQQLQDASTPEEEMAALLGVVSTIIHETIHAGQNGGGTRTAEDIDGSFSRNTHFDGSEYVDEYFFNGVNVGNTYESGNAFENAIWDFGGKLEGLKQGAQGQKDQSSKYFFNWYFGNSGALPKIE